MRRFPLSLPIPVRRCLLPTKRVRASFHRDRGFLLHERKLIYMRRTHPLSWCLSYALPSIMNGSRQVKRSQRPNALCVRVGRR